MLLKGKKRQANMLNTLKRAKQRVEEGRAIEGDEDRVACLTKYQALGRYDEQKQLLLANWEGDKGLQWWKSFEEKQGWCMKRDETALEGHGSRLVQHVHSQVDDS